MYSVSLAYATSASWLGGEHQESLLEDFLAPR